ncbi:hypothetical protein FJQ98_22260 [Lysinibacillus agricola]|uniref:Uncharacterized protein n=1 Tax=Lysinibacillus agricola TaxID=2590012 RepID=A0ABX7AQS0_9BACI|nr:MULTISPECIES: hypothetical protein [Lysinibacillus]QQP11872.1 hypothetical protein FJQ98_22260 [Lysinibacillus agricola]
MFYLCESKATATKRPVGTEINPSFCRRTILYLISFFQHYAEAGTELVYLEK